MVRHDGKNKRAKEPDALSTRSGEGLDHKSLLYIALFRISSGHMTVTLPITPRLEERIM